MASPSETVRSFVAQGCFDLFLGAGKGGNTIESLVPRCYALGAVSFVDRGCVDLFADAVKWGQC